MANFFGFLGITCVGGLFAAGLLGMQTEAIGFCLTGIGCMGISLALSNERL
jgi:hypothetical protein